MKKRSAISCLSALFLVMAFASCIKNDVPYPRIRQEILSLAAEGESLPAVIDVENLKATVYPEEDVDIRAVRFAEFTFTEGASCSTDLSVRLFRPCFASQYSHITLSGLYLDCFGCAGD